MRRKYYLHRRNGIFYAEPADPVSGHKLNAKSTGERNNENALLVVSDWLKNGISAGHNQNRRPANELFHAAGLKTAIKTAEISPHDALLIVDDLKDQGLIASNPTMGTKRPSGSGRKRDILMREEITALYSLRWQDERGRLAFLIGLTCGLRLGEIAALQLRDIGEDRLFVRDSIM